MLKECGHCFNQVLPLEGGICPACRKDFNAPSIHPAHVTACVVRRDDAKPCICIFCGGASTEDILIEETFNRSMPVSNEDRAVASFGGFLGLAMVLFKNRKPPKRVAVDLPVCDSCAGNKPEVLSVRPDEEAVRVVVHREFRREFEKLNEFG